MHIVRSVDQRNKSWYSDRHLTNGVQWKTETLKSLLYIIFLYHSLSFLNLAVSIYFWVSQNISDFCICLFLCVPSSLIFSMYGWYRTHLLVTCLRSFEMHCDNFMWSLTHWGRDKMDAISQTTFSSAFSWMKIFEIRLKFHRSLFPRIQLTIFQHWFR